MAKRTLLGAVVRHFRIEAGLSLRELATRLRTDHAYLHRIERGDNVPSLQFLCRLCKALGAEVDTFQPLAEAAIVQRWRDGAP